MDNGKDWRTYHILLRADPDAAENGRRLAAHAVATDPDARKRVEDSVGVEVARQMYPEAYANTGRTGIAGLLDKFRASIPW